MITTYILEIEDFINRADITSNLQTSKLKSYLGVIQEKYAPKILCRELYNTVISQIESDTFTQPIEDLLPYLKDYLIYKTYARYLLNADVLSTPSGLRVQVDTTSQSLDSETRGAIIAQAKNDANFYQDELVNFLNLNSEEYPDWVDSKCGCSKGYSKRNNQFSLIGADRNVDERIKWT